MLLDFHGRRIHYLRISVSNGCNLRCVYCMPKGGAASREKLLGKEEIVSIAKAAVTLGIDKIRLTGGEPLLRQDILEIAREIAGLEGLKELCLTTNGILLKQYAKGLKDAGVNRINVSLDSLKPEKYTLLTGGGVLQKVLEGIQEAKVAGFDPIKINVVLLAGKNEDEIVDFIHFGKGLGVDIRFIEQMPIGASAKKEQQYFTPGKTVLTAYPSLVAITPGNSARLEQLYQVPNSKGKVGLITPMEEGFCSSCNRIRVTADGMLKPCLHTDKEIPLLGLDQGALQETIKTAILEKPEKHYLQERKTSDSTRNMCEIGG